MREYLREGELNPAVTATQTGFYRLFAAWILDESLPWTTGEAPTLQILFKYLKVNFILPTDTTVRNHLVKIFAELHGKVVREFSVSGLSNQKLRLINILIKNVKSKIAYATDTWTTKQMVYTFACTIASFINDDWNIIERVVDFKPLEDKEHGGVLGGMAFINGAQQRGGLDKMSRHGLTFEWCHFYLLHSYIYFISLTSDNASVNDIIVETAARCLLARYNIPWTPDMHIRCIAHVINLVVQAFLYGIDEADDPDIVDNFDSNKDTPIHYNINEDEDQIAMENEAMEDLASQADIQESVNLAEEAILMEEITGQSPIKRVSVLYMLDIIVLIVSRIIS